MGVASTSPAMPAFPFSALPAQKQAHRHQRLRGRLGSPAGQSLSRPASVSHQIWQPFRHRSARTLKPATRRVGPESWQHLGNPPFPVFVNTQSPAFKRSEPVPSCRGNGDPPDIASSDRPRCNCPPAVSRCMAAAHDTAAPLCEHVPLVPAGVPASRGVVTSPDGGFGLSKFVPQLAARLTACRRSIDACCRVRPGTWERDGEGVVLLTGPPCPKFGQPMAVPSVLP